jgi:hypothetical protein
MKKFLPILILAFVSLFIFSCDKDDDNFVDHDTFPIMKDATGTFTSGENYTLSLDINIQSTDVVLVYRNINSNTNNAAVWQLLPKTFFLEGAGNRQLDYNFTFDSKNVDITTQANFDQNTMSGPEKAKYLTNQTFRTVLVPADPAKNAKKASVDYNDYNAVVKYYNLDESKVVKTNVK